MNPSQRSLIVSLPDQEVMARTVYGEARGEGVLGLLGVANVIMNRFKGASRYGNGITGVCLKDWQFSCWNDDDANLEKLLKLRMAGKWIEQCRTVAELVIEEMVKDNTFGATHYHSSRMKVFPSWSRANNVKYRTTIGNHIFYQEL